MGVRKKKEPEKIEFKNEFYIVSGDISLRRPGFAILHLEKIDYDKIGIDGVVRIKNLKTIVVNNKSNKKPVGGVLNDICMFLTDFISDNVDLNKDVFFVREKFVSKHNSINEANIFKAVGISDLVSWKINKDWAEIYPVSIKKIITGNGFATKEEVAKDLKRYIGNVDFEFDDESDAVAVAISYLIQNGVTSIVI